jgi:hypothetical protein
MPDFVQTRAKIGPNIPSAAKPGPPAGAPVPSPPANTKQLVAQGVRDAADNYSTVAKYAGMVANPSGALLGAAAESMDEKLASLTSGISALLPSFPAATLGSVALGLPHAHYTHPPSGPPPVPPTPLPPLGPVLLGTCLQVLINSKPAARCGDIGLNPTCCGIPPMYEIFTGSSKVFIGGARAARATFDITMHCKPSAGPGGRAGAMAAKLAAKSAMIAKVAKAAAAAGRVAGKVAGVAGTVASAAGKAAQVSSLGADIAEAVAEDDAAMSSAMGLNTAMMAAQMAADAAAMAASAAMGKDPVVPPTGTPGMILQGSPNVLIGGVPLPASMAIAQGLLKKLKGRRARVPCGAGSAGTGK